MTDSPLASSLVLRASVLPQYADVLTPRVLSVLSALAHSMGSA